MYHFIGISSGMIEPEELFIDGSFISKSKPMESTLKDEQASQCDLKCEISFELLTLI